MKDIKENLEWMNENNKWLKITIIFRFSWISMKKYQSIMAAQSLFYLHLKLTGKENQAPGLVI